MALEAQMRAAATALGVSGEESGPAPDDNLLPQRSLTDGRVVSLKEELSLIVANIGKREGVQVGMPFKVVRDRKIIATVRVVDVREKIAGAVIVSQENEKTKIRAGDRLLIEAR
jgi:hypothetical protein